MLSLDGKATDKREFASSLKLHVFYFSSKEKQECFVLAELLLCCRACRYSFHSMPDYCMEMIQDTLGVELQWVNVFSKENISCVGPCRGF